MSGERGLVGPAATFGQSGRLTDPPPLVGGPIRELLSGQKIALTGVTGFIGEQLLWKVLTELPETRVAVLVRRKGSLSARDRVVNLLKKPIFASLRDEAGSPQALCEQRVEVIEGDLPHVPQLPRDIDVLVHCAGDVSFDPPIDDAFRTNVVGTQALLERFIESATGSDGTLERVPHYVHISTAYTAGRRRGAIPEALHIHDVDYQVETQAAIDMGAHIQRRSRSAEQLAILRKQAELEHQQAGFLTTAADTERRRLEWVRRELVKAGTERARSLGWTDVYTFAKAMGERVVADVARDLRVSIVRPAIVESSLRDPHPGWIEGFKMADPIILSYARGELPEFPASPDSVLDIIPCDYVVNTIVAVCATQPEVGHIEVYHASSGARNPLTFQNIYHQLRTYLAEKPFVRDGKPAPLAEWKFPGHAPVERAIRLGEWGTRWGNRALRLAPRSQWTREMALRMDKQVDQLDFYRKYITLYGEYLQSQLHFVDDRTLALHNSLVEEDREVFGFDSADFSWDHYLREVHFPAILDPVQRLENARKRREGRATTYRALKPAERPVLAAFDLDGTVMATNVVETYLAARLPELSPLDRVLEVGGVLRRLPRYLGAERRDRSDFLRAVYRRFEGMRMEDLEQIVDTRLADFIADRTAPDAIARLEEHRAAGHTTVLLTGAARPFTRPLEKYFDIIVAAELSVDEQGVCTGFLQGPPMVGESRSAWLRHYAQLHEVDLRDCYAYADSHVDLPMLRAVGHPVAVSPDVGLLRAAKQRGWSIVDWPVSAPKRHRLSV
ncbi:HAD-IB family hydrolase [Aestuariimicrobium sp. p3-SID1156]|uniref:HAD-IB family hydrolase n=1 Tax=Aestuariimicrobium sp. p3-SID1156 TaxID=2916038 RepID=UPI00223A9CD6|nr:HAD-IB family hydrolase [Aestuariimicrobium sp. p3-SID1156]MCT1459500.1 HAD-IB family hydrolase [Aestuariimicrobium sp. p3-SID1156]